MPVVVLIDGLDSLPEGTLADLPWLPAQLPPHARIVLTCRPSPLWSTLARRVDDRSPYFVALQHWTGGQARDFYRSSGTRLPAVQEAALLAALGACSSALYCSLALALARHWTPQQAPPPLPPSVEGLAAGAMAGWLAVNDAAWSRRAVGFLAAAAGGSVTEQELLDVLSRDPVLVGGQAAASAGQAVIAARRQPAFLWLRLRAALEPALLVQPSRSGALLLHWRHDVFAATVRALFDDAEWAGLHGTLADYWSGHTAEGPPLDPALTRDIDPQLLLPAADDARAWAARRSLSELCIHAGSGTRTAHGPMLARAARTRRDGLQRRLWRAVNTRRLEALPHHLLAAGRAEALLAAVLDLGALEAAVALGARVLWDRRAAAVAGLETLLAAQPDGADLAAEVRRLERLLALARPMLGASPDGTVAAVLAALLPPLRTAGAASHRWGDATPVPGDGVVLRREPAAGPPLPPLEASWAGSRLAPLLLRQRDSLEVPFRLVPRTCATPFQATGPLASLDRLAAGPPVAAALTFSAGAGAVAVALTRGGQCRLVARRLPAGPDTHDIEVTGAPGDGRRHVRAPSLLALSAGAEFAITACGGDGSGEGVAAGEVFALVWDLRQGRRPAGEGLEEGAHRRVDVPGPVCGVGMQADAGRRQPHAICVTAQHVLVRALDGPFAARCEHGLNRLGASYCPEAAPGDVWLWAAEASTARLFRFTEAAGLALLCELQQPGPVRSMAIDVLGNAVLAGRGWLAVWDARDTSMTQQQQQQQEEAGAAAPLLLLQGQDWDGRCVAAVGEKLAVTRGGDLRFVSVSAQAVVGQARAHAGGALALALATGGEGGDELYSCSVDGSVATLHARSALLRGDHGMGLARGTVVAVVALPGTADDDAPAAQAVGFADGSVALLADSAAAVGALWQAPPQETLLALAAMPRDVVVCLVRVGDGGEQSAAGAAGGTHLLRAWATADAASSSISTEMALHCWWRQDGAARPTCLCAVPGLDRVVVGWSDGTLTLAPPVDASTGALCGAAGQDALGTLRGCCERAVCLPATAPGAFALAVLTTLPEDESLQPRGLLWLTAFRPGLSGGGVDWAATSRCSHDAPFSALATARGSRSDVLVTGAADGTLSVWRRSREDQHKVCAAVRLLMHVFLCAWCVSECE